MNQTEQTLLEQMHITEFEIEHRKALFSFTADDAKLLLTCRPAIEKIIDPLVSAFYQKQTSVPEIALLIGDADTLLRLHNAQRRYVLDLFSGVYDLEYVNNRLRIGLVHKRIGVEPKLYLSAVHILNGLLYDGIDKAVTEEATRQATQAALDKLFLFDVTLVFDTYIRSLVSEIEIAKDRTEQYARSLEEKVKERTRQLEELSRVDPLTGLQNVRHLKETLTKLLRSAQRRGEPVSLVYIDVNDFKKINDIQGHQRGDEILRTVGLSIKSVSRADDSCYRYGGDEFCIILPDCREEQAREIYTVRLNEHISRRLDKVSLSIGIVQTGPNEYLDVDTLVKQADEKMYTAKKAFKAQPLSQ